MKICLIGNGSSNNLYSRNDEKYDLVICCNIPQHGFEWDVISIIDPQPVRIIGDKKINLKRIWCPPDTYKVSQSKKLHGKWEGVYKRKSWYNSGLIAVDYVCQTYSDLKEIHLWGINSLYEDNFHSQMDNLVPRTRKRNLNSYWVPRWKEVISKYENVTFYAHIPSDQIPKEEYRTYNNFKSYYHSIQ